MRCPLASRHPSKMPARRDHRSASHGQCEGNCSPGWPLARPGRAARWETSLPLLCCAVASKTKRNDRATIIDVASKFLKSHNGCQPHLFNAIICQKLRFQAYKSISSMNIAGHATRHMTDLVSLAQGLVCALRTSHTATNALSTCAKSAPRSSPPQHARTHIRRGSAPYMYITRLGAHLSASSYSVVESQKHAQVLPDHTQSPTVHAVSCGAGCRGWHGQDLCHPRERTIRPDRSRASIIRGRRMKLQQ